MNYTLHQLKIFVRVCDYQSVTKAAESLYMTQPAVSIQLKKLQSEFKIPLTEVIGRQLYVTDFGKQIKGLAESILNNTELIEAATQRYKGILVGKITIASASTGKYVIPYFLTEFMHQHPGVEIFIDVTNKTKVVQRLQENSIDFAMVSVQPSHLTLNAIPLIDNELHLVSSPTYPNLPAKMTHKNVEKFPLIFREEGSATRSAMTRYLNQYSIKTKRAIYLVSNEAVKQAVRAGLGLSIMPLIGIRSELQLGNLVTLDIKGLPIKTQWNLVYASNKQLSPAAEALVSYLEQNKTRIAETHFSQSISE